MSALQRGRSCAASAVLVLALALALASPALTQIEAWRAQYDSDLSDPVSFFEFFGTPIFQGRQAALAADGSHYAVVSVEDGDFRSILVRHDADGALAWVRDRVDRGIGAVVAIDGDGNVYVSGRGAGNCAELQKVAPDGEVLWSVAPEGIDPCAVHVTEVVAGDGALYVVGSASSAEAIYVARFSADGAQDWSFVRDVAPDTQAGVWAVDVDSEGALVVAASHWNPTVDFLVVKIEPDGDLAWERSYDGGSYDLPLSIAAGPAGEVTVSGFSLGNDPEGGGYDYQTIQFDAQGTELWSARVERQTFFGPFWWTPISPAIAYDSNGNVFLTGSIGPDDGVELLLVKYGPTGSELFRKTFPHYAEGRRLVVDALDRVYVAAPMLVGDDRAAAVFAFTNDGDLLWREQTDLVLYTMPVTLSQATGRLVMTASVGEGEVDAPTSTDTLWVGFDADGKVWEAGEPVTGLTELFCGSTCAGDIVNRAGSCLVAGSDGSTYLGGSSVANPLQPFSTYQHRLVKLDPAGALEWTRGFSLAAEDATNGGGTALAAAASGNVHLSGPDWVTVTHDAAGNEQWVHSLEQPVDVRATGTDSSGAVYVLGQTRVGSNPSSIDVRLAKAAPDGTPLWTRTFAGPGGGTDEASALLVTPDDRVVFVGQASVPGRADALVRAYDAAGNVVFSQTLQAVGDPTGDATLTALAVDGDDVLAVGQAAGADDLDVLAVRLDAAGGVVWRRDLDGGGGDDAASAVAVDPDGNAYVTGRTWNGDDFDVLIVKLGPKGDELWRRAIDLGDGDDEAWSAAFDAPGAGGAPGSLWIAGRATNGVDFDALTLHFDFAGNELFRAVVAGSEQRDDEHYDLVVGPVPGHATVAGTSAEIDESHNFQAIRYVTSPLDVDYDGESSALTDGILILRWLFGLRDSPLAAGAVDLAGCERCAGAQAGLHLAALAALLDVDGDGGAGALTDGVLLFRWLFGLRGAALVTGVVDLGACTRCDAPAIDAYLEELAD